MKNAEYFQAWMNMEIKFLKVFQLLTQRILFVLSLPPPPEKIVIISSCHLLVGQNLFEVENMTDFTFFFSSFNQQPVK